MMFSRHALCRRTPDRRTRRPDRLTNRLFRATAHERIPEIVCVQSLLGLVGPDVEPLMELSRREGANSSSWKLRPPIQPEPEEDAFATVKGEAGEGEAPAELLKAEPPVKLDRGGVASVGEEPGVGSAFADPVDAGLRERCANAAATLVGDDEDAGEVVAAWGCIGRSFPLRLEQTNATIADEHT